VTRLGLSSWAAPQLCALGIDVRTGASVVGADAQGFLLIVASMFPRR